jgi:oligopeptide/dipeptide ABC transporter ATP-binding protein
MISIACVHMSGLLMRSLRPLAKVGFATPVPIMPAVSVGQWVPRSFARQGSIDHAIFLPLQELVVAFLRCFCRCGYADRAAPGEAAVKAGRRPPPVSALDVSVQAQIINLLESLQKRLGLAMLFIAHDLAVVRHTATSVAVMYLGHILETAPTDALFSTPRHPYTEALLSAVPLPDPNPHRERIILRGDTPSPLRPPSGCPFRTRCAQALPKCASAEIRLKEYIPGRKSACIRHDELYNSLDKM